MKRTLILATAFAALGLGAYAAESSCVKCHTDESTMKSLFVPPAISSAEGEG